MTKKAIANKVTAKKKVPRSPIFRKFFIIAFTIVALATAIFFINQEIVSRQLSRIAGATAVVVSAQPEETVYNREDERYIPDYPFFTFKTGESVVGILSGGGDGAKTAYQTLTPLDSKVMPITEMPGVVSGAAPRYFDSGGIWPNAVFQKKGNPQVIHGFYHAEKYKNAQKREDDRHYTAGYMKSTDGGKTWSKPNYPNNIILKGYDETDLKGGADPYSLVKVTEAGKGYLYMYYYEHTGNDRTRGMAVARAPIETNGVPGSWKKFYCNDGRCGFTEPGIRGRFTKLGLDGQSWVSYNTYLKTYIAVDLDPIFSTGKLQLKAAADGLSWSNLGNPVNLGNVKKSESSTIEWKRTYVSLVSTDGTPGETGQSFYLYYVLLPWDKENGYPAAGVTRRLLQRRLITLK